MYASKVLSFRASTSKATLSVGVSASWSLAVGAFVVFPPRILSGLLAREAGRELESMRIHPSAETLQRAMASRVRCGPETAELSDCLLRLYRDIGEGTAFS